MYCAPDDLIGLLPESDLLRLAADVAADGWDAPAVRAVVTRTIVEADSRIDGYVGTVRSVPLNPIPALIAALSRDLAVAGLFRRRGPVPEEWQAAETRALRNLEKIAEGKIVLGAPDVTGVQAAPESAVLVAAPGREFGPDLLRRF